MDRPGQRTGVLAVRGFTMVELAATLAIASILAVLAIPAFDSVIANQRVTTASADLYVSLARTRSTAGALNQNVTLAANPGGWANGWVILNPNNPAGPPMETHAAVSGIQVLSTYNTVTYRPSGRLPVGTSPAPSFVFQATTRSSNATRCVSIDLSGRPFKTTGTTC